MHWCSQQRGHPAIPLEQYGVDDLKREGRRVKPCAPMCTVGCVHRVAQVDELRQRPQEALAQWFPASGGGDSVALPPAVRALRWAFVTGPRRDLFRSVAARLAGTHKHA